MGLIREADFPTKYLVGIAGFDKNFVFFVRIDRSLAEMIRKAKEELKNFGYNSILEISFYDHTPEYLNNKDNKFLHDNKEEYLYALPFDVDDYFQTNGYSERLFLCQSILSVSEYGFGWRGITDRGKEVETPFFDFRVLENL